MPSSVPLSSCGPAGGAAGGGGTYAFRGRGTHYQHRRDDGRPSARAGGARPLLRPDKVERREFAYIRHGTLSLIINFDVVTGEVIYSSIGPTRNEAGFLAHIRSAAESAPSTSQLYVALDNLSTHCRRSGAYVPEV